MAGYNPNMSLLPQGSGTIHAMSGGGGAIGGDTMNGGYQFTPPMGYNPSNSVIQAGYGAIHPFSGGVYNQHVDGEMMGAGPKLKKPRAKVTPITVPPVPNTSASVPSVPAVINTGASVPAVPPVPDNVPSVPAATNTGASVPPVTNTGASVPSVTGDSDANSSKVNVDNTKSSIILFGTQLFLENPSINPTKPLEADQLTALQLFGIDGPGVTDKEKRGVVQALYDGKCNTDKPLIMLNDCEPIRRIIQRARSSRGSLSGGRGP